MFTTIYKGIFTCCAIFGIATQIHTAPDALEHPHAPRNIFEAIYKGSAKAVKAYIDRGYDINIRNRISGNTPLYTAIFAGKIDIVRMLCNQETIDINAENTTKNTPLHRACKISNDITRRTIIAILLNSGADVNVKNNQKETPLHVATDLPSCNLYTVYMLIHKNARLNQKDEDGNTPLHNVTKYQSLNHVAETLIQHGAHLNSHNAHHATPLHNAAYADHASMCELFIDYGAHINKQDSDGNTPLHHAVYAQSHKTVKILIQHGADAHICNNNNMTPAQYARHLGDTTIADTIFFARMQQLRIR